MMIKAVFANLLACSLAATSNETLETTAAAAGTCTTAVNSEAAAADEALLVQIRRRATDETEETMQLQGFQFRLLGQDAARRRRRRKNARYARWNDPTPTSLCELKQPKRVHSPVVLTVQESILPTDFIKKGSYAIVRSFDGTIPGPMIVMYPGSVNHVRVRNNLGYNTDKSGFCNEKEARKLRYLEGVGPRSEHFCELNTTNFHTHGLHTSSLFGGDEVRKTRIHPQTHFDFIFELPHYHMGGTHWYHPHVHSSTAVQAGGGMHGFILVEDIPGHLPPFIEKMRQVFIFLSGVDMHLSTKFERLGTDVEKIKGTGASGFWRWFPCGGPGEEVEPAEPGEEPEPRDCAAVDPLTDEGSAFWEKIGLVKNAKILVNGQWQPKLTMEAHKWYRFRMAHASIELTLHLGLANPKLCRVGLLAKDGVYLEEGPRWLRGPITLSVANRADLAIACKCPKEVKSCGTWLMYQFAHHEDHRMVTDKVMYLHIKEDSSSYSTSYSTSSTYISTTSMHLPTYHLKRPCYMADLRGLGVYHKNMHDLSLPCDLQERCGKYNVTYDGVTHTTPSTALIDHLTLGTLYEWNFFHGVQYHPLHLHVTPFQITEIGRFFKPFYQDFEDDEWKHWNFFEVGDWHDTLRMPHRESVKLRMLPNTFTGDYMFHCHFLDHEDAGLMGYFAVGGREGTRNEDAQKHDPLCFWDAREAGWGMGAVPPIRRSSKLGGAAYKTQYKYEEHSRMDEKGDYAHHKDKNHDRYRH